MNEGENKPGPCERVGALGFTIWPEGGNICVGVSPERSLGYQNDDPAEVSQEFLKIFDRAVVDKTAELQKKVEDLLRENERLFNICEKKQKVIEAYMDLREEYWNQRREK